MDDVYSGLEPVDVWRHFSMLNRIPRCSGQEVGAREYVQQVAGAVGMRWKVDERGNVVVYVPARDTEIAAPLVAIQAHLDMVCEKQPGVTHNFAEDPIRPRRVGDRIFASGTTLGADNGIGVAMILALITQSSLRHGPLELIFTVEEETGLRGALELNPSLIGARLLINLDDEEPDELVVGCAGAADAILRFPLVIRTMPDGYSGREVIISGLRGGHSGTDIHEPRANAIKLLTSALADLLDTGVNVHLVSIEGGSVRNAIPRTATARFLAAPDTLPSLETAIANVRETLYGEWGKDEPNLALDVREVPVSNQVILDDSGDVLLGLLNNLPYGLLAMSKTFPGKVETSSNLARVRALGEEVEILISSRSFSDIKLREVQSRIRELGEAVGAEVELQEGYPGWEPNPRSTLLKQTVGVYQQVYGKPPEVEVIHGGLECGVLVSKLPNMEAISFGPLIRGAHTTEECIYPSTVPPTWKLLVALLETLAQ
jgi:dipeptidase D